MRDEARKLVDKAVLSLEAAQGLAADGYAEFAIARAYYAMFYAAEALLVEKGLTFRKHAGVHAAFGQHFAKTGLMDAQYHRWLLDAFDKRLVSDYGIDQTLTTQDAQVVIGQAVGFLRAAEAWLQGAHQP